MEGTGSGFFRFQNRLSSTWSVNENNVSADQEVDLTLRLGLDLPEENQEAPAQGVILQSFSNNIKIPTLHHQGMENSEILQNAGEGLERKLDHKPWPLPVLNMLSNNWNNISGNSVIRQQQQQQQQKRCTTCQKTDTPLWRKGPDGPRTLCNGCGLRYARDTCRGTEFAHR